MILNYLPFFRGASYGEGQYFFSDIKKEGVLLYDAGSIPLAEQKELNPVERKKLAQEDFDYWYGDAVKFMKGAMLYANDKDLNMAAFMLHQTAERAHNAAILVFTGYKPRTHNIGKLIRLSRDFSPELAGIFPNNTKEETNLFNLLKKAYIRARYRKDYVIIETDLTELIDRIRHLLVIAERICKEKIASLGTLTE